MKNFQILLFMWLLPVVGFTQANYLFLNYNILSEAMKEHTDSFTYLETKIVGEKRMPHVGKYYVYVHKYKHTKVDVEYHFYTMSSTVICLKITGDISAIDDHTESWLANKSRDNFDSRYRLGAYYHVPDPYDVTYVYHVYRTQTTNGVSVYLSINEEILHNDILK